MKISNLDALITSYTKLRLSSCLASNIYELTNFPEEDYYNFNDAKISDIANKLPIYFSNIKNVLPLNFTDREPYINNIKEDIKTLLDLSLNIVCLNNFRDFLVDAFLNKSLYIIATEGGVKPDKKETEKLLELILESDDAFLQSLLLSIINFNLDENAYKNYLKNSFAIVNEVYEDDEISYVFNSFLLDFAPFHFIKDSEEKQELIDIWSKLNEDLSETEIQTILDELTTKPYSNYLGDINTIYMCFMDIFLIYTLAPNLDTLLNDAFALKDAYFATQEMIEQNSYELICDNIRDVIEPLLEELFDESDKTLNIIFKTIDSGKVKDAKKYNTILNRFEILPIENKVSPNYSSPSSLEVSDFLSFIDSLKLDTIKLNLLKQKFFKKIPIGMDCEEMHKYAQTFIENAPNEDFAILNLNLNAMLS